MRCSSVSSTSSRRSSVSGRPTSTCTTRDGRRCAAPPFTGCPDDLVGVEFTDDLGLAGEAVRLGKPVIAADYTAFAAPLPHPAYADFTGAIVAPIGWSGETQGSARRGLSRRAILRRARPRADRRLRVARGGRASQRRDVRGALASGTRAARLLAHRNRARPAALPHEDARRGGTGRDGGARRALGRGADAEEGCRARAGRLVRAAGEPGGDARRGPAPLGRRPERLRGGTSRDRGPFDRRGLALRPGVEGARPRGGGERAARRSARDEPGGQLRRRARALRGGTPLHGRRPRAGRTARAGGARRARAQRALRVGAKRACARATARAHGQPPRDRARPRHGARGGRPARAASARGRRVRDPRARRRRAAADGRERQGRGRARRNPLAGLRPALRRRLPVAHVDGDRRRGRRTRAMPRPIRFSPPGSARTSAFRSSVPRAPSTACSRSTPTGRERGGPRRSRRWRRLPRTRRPRSRTPSSSRRSPSTASGATRSSRTSPTGSSPSTASRTSSSGTRPQSASRACPPATRSAARSRTSSSAPSRPAGCSRAGSSRSSAAPRRCGSR